MLPISFLASLDINVTYEIALLHKRLTPATFQKLEFSNNDLKWGPWPPGKDSWPDRGLKFVHFWAIECKPCMQELPEIKKIMSKLKSQNVFPIYITETQNKMQITEFYRKNPQLFLAEAGHYYSASSANRDSWGIAVQPLTLLIDNKNVIHRAFVGSLQGRQDVFDESFALSVRAMKGLSSAPSCPDPKACVAKEPPGGPEGGKVDWRQLLDELRRQGGLLAALQESLKRLEENQNKAPQPGAPIPDLTAQLTSIQGQLQRNEQDLSRVRSQAAESRRASWYQMGGLAALLLGALSGLLFWLERRRGAARA